MQKAISIIIFLSLTSMNIKAGDIVEKKATPQRPRIIHNQKTKLSEILVFKPSEKDLAIVEKQGKKIIYMPILEPSKYKINHLKKIVRE